MPAPSQDPFGHTDAVGLPDSWARTLGTVLLDLVGFIGLALGGGQAAAAGWLDKLQHDSLYANGDTPLSPDRLAEIALKSAAGVDWAANEAQKSGLSRGNFDTLMRSIGNPPGAGELLDMWRRGIIDQATFELGLRQGYTRNDWIDRIAATRHAILPVGEIVAAAVQGHMPFGEAVTAASLHGIDADEFNILFATAGNPPGPMEILNLWVRGYIGEADVDQALRESRLKDKWIPALKQLAVHKLPMRTITTLLTHGAITDESAIQHLRELGFADEDARALVTSAHFAKAHPAKQLSVAAVRSLYTEHAITRDEAVADLVAIGYTDTVAQQIMQLADIDVKNATRKAAITKVRAAYDTRKIDRHTASNELDALHVDPHQRDQLLDLWDVELAVNVRQLTEAQVAAAGREKLFSESEVLDRFVSMGYSQEDAFVLAVIGKVIALPTTQPGG